ncbi:DUF262 domain-containing protein [Vibrio pomeroyi]|uniref:DUF262 domain-containing protein n=1 Tax=Vibrio pomeroyi TaxID=198832 RepID=UPI0021C2658E|nr:DUF262 domain-containing protein [Vibrio pomeroyi]
MAIIDKQVFSIKDMLELPLTIPDYQRPYKWHARHVNQLLDDVLRHRNKSSYRLGTVVIHEEQANQSQSFQQLSIVDGQQRLLTLTLLCNLIDNKRVCNPTLLEHNFDSPTTVRNLQHNAAIIQSRLKQLSEADREELVEFLLHKCELISVKLDDLSEAFQFFDSQNARGKALAPYDLLKAFHLREMAVNSEQERLACVDSWESGVSPDNKAPSLQMIMSDILFRLRRWSEGEQGKYFTRNNIDVFKGVNLSSATYRYAESLRAMDYMVDEYNSDRVRHWDQQMMPYPFLVDQTILNGKRFFEYIEHYTKAYQNLFIDEKPELTKILKTITSYKGRNRVGDHYVRNLFYCAVLYYYDKFGDAELEKAALLCFVWSYRIRLVQHRVVIESIDNPAMEKQGIFKVIKKALHPHEVFSFAVEPVHESDIKGTKIDGLIEMFKALGYVQSEQ